MVCRGCGKESADEFSFCPHCGKQRVTQIVCPSCARESSADFSFCPHCGKAFVSALSGAVPPAPPPEVEAVEQEQTDQQIQTESGKTDRSNEIGTYVFGSFAVLALVVSIVKGIVPIYLFESAVWAGAAWYWHRKKTHSELAKAIVIVLAALIAIGEVIQVAREFNKPSTAPANQSTDPFEKYAVPSGSSTTPYSAYVPAASPDQTAASTGSTPGSDVAEVERQAVALYKQKRYSDARPLFDQACNGGEMKACNYLGYLYAQGLGGAHDIQKARDLYQRACEQGTLSSCASLGSLYQDAGDNDNARRFFQKACNGGINEACDLLRNVK
jgi:hypothetical protein